MPRYIQVYENVVSKEICEKLMAKFDSDARVTKDPQPDYSTRNYLNLSLHSDWLAPVFPLIEASNNIAEKYFARPEGLEESGIEDWMDDGFIMAKYSKGDDLVLHVDGQSAEEPNNGLRLASLVFFLNNCQGGETHFPLQEVTIKPSQGSAVIFPPGHTHPHEVWPAKTNRYIVQTWLTDPQYKVMFREH